MYTIKLSQAELKKLKQLKNKERDKKIFRRLQCIQLRHKGKSNQEIADIIGVCKDTVMDWVKLYLDEGFLGLCTLNYDGRKQSRIDPHIEAIRRDLKENTIATLSQLQAWLKDNYAIEMESSWLSRCCKKNSIYLTRKPV